MTIGEKAEEYACTQDCDACAGFVDGAEWMLEKACEYLKNQLPIQYPEWKELAEENVRQFKKAMEE